MLSGILNNIYVFGSGSTFGGLGEGAAPPPPPPYRGQSRTSGFGGQSGTPIFGGQSETSRFGVQSSSAQAASVFGEKKSSTGDRSTVFESIASTTTPTELFKR